MFWNIFLILLSVLNTYSLPTISLLKYIQNSDENTCPKLRNKLLNCYAELDYLKTCVNSFNPKSSNAEDIRCNLYLSQFQLLCAADSRLLSDPEVCLTRGDFEKVFENNKGMNILNDTCGVFARATKNGPIDEFIVKKCRWICTDIRTDEVDMLCVAASYLRMIVLKNELLALRNVAIDGSETSRNVTKLMTPMQNKLALNRGNVGNLRDLDEPNGGVAVESSVGTTGKGEVSPQVTEHDIKGSIGLMMEGGGGVRNKENIENSIKINGNAVDVKDKMDLGDQTAMSGYPQENILINSKSTSNEILNTNAIIKPNVSTPFVQSKSIEKATTSRLIDSSSIAAVKNDLIDADDLSPQNTAQQSDYSDGKGNFENSPVTEFDSHNVKHPGMTENEDDTINPNLYRDVSTVQDDSYFFTYFMMLCVVFIFAYVGYHNKQKIIAIVVEGRRGNSAGGRGGRSRGARRPNSANYHKLDSNLEEAVSSTTTNKNTSKVIY